MEKIPNMQQVDLGFTKFEVSRQSIIVFTFFTFINIVAVGIMLYTTHTVFSTVYLVIYAIIYMMIVISFAILLGYIVNCTIVGKCIKLSWVIVGFYSFFMMIYLATLMGIAVGSAIGTKAIINGLKNKK